MAPVDSPPVEQTAPAPAPAPEDPGATVIVTGEAPITSASALTADEKQLAVRPIARAGDVAEVMPGLFAVQHAGGGKANQYFVRGFDADHGTDVAIAVDGVPVNMVSHAHGQGYADLHFLIPELVSSVDVRKGPYEAFDGDLATAGALDMHLVDSVDHSYATGEVGSFGIYRGLLVAGMKAGSTTGLVAGEFYGDNGPFTLPESLVRFNVVSKVTTKLGDDAKLKVGLSAYGSGWHASGENPLRAVESGDLSVWGTEDPSQGGQSTRRQVWAQVDATPKQGQAFTALAYAGTYHLNLYTNFTFFTDDPVHGDEIEQEDDRTFAGFDAAWRDRADVGDFRLSTRVGAQGREDRIDPRLYHDEDRVRLDTRVDDHVDEARIGLYVREEVAWLDKVRLIGALRGDEFDFAVDDRLTNQSGSKQAPVLSPKANLVVSPTSFLDLYANFGRGFHSNDARGVVATTDPVTPITQATGYEGGFRLHRPGLGQVAVAAWGLDLTAETVWVGDEGTTALNGPTHRQGLDVSVRANPLPWLLADFDLTLAKATYTQDPGNANAVALAPPETMAGGIGIDDLHGLTAGVRVRQISNRPANEDGSVTAAGWTILSAEAKYRWKFLEGGLAVDNLLNASWKEVQFDTTTRLQDEPEPVEDITFTPGWPRTFRATLTVYR